MFTNTCKTEQESGCIFSLKKVHFDMDNTLYRLSGKSDKQ